MTQLVVQAAGAVVGYFVSGGNPYGAAIGWSLGAAVAPLLEPDKNAYGPRLEELRFSRSSYGVTVPIVLGAMRVGANIIWLGEVEEVAAKQKVGKNAYSTSFSYRQSFAATLCDGPVAGVRRIWFDNQLVYSTVAGDVITALEAGKLSELMTVYAGTESQLPDPVMESEMGVGEVPAYRGICYVVFERLDLTQWGNRLPNINAEVIESGSYTSPVLISELPIGVTGGAARMVGATIEMADWTGGGAPQCQLRVMNPSSGAIVGSQYFLSPPITPLVANDPFPCVNDPRVAYADAGDPNPPLIDPGPPPVYAVTGRGMWLMAATVADAVTGLPRAVVVANSFSVGTTNQVIDFCLVFGDYIYAIGGAGAGGITASNPPVLRAFRFDPLNLFVSTLPTYELRLDVLGVVGSGGAPWLATDGTYLYARWSGFVTKAYSVFKFTAELALVEEISTGLGSYAVPFAVWDGMLLDAFSILLPNYSLAQRKLNGDGTATLMGTAGSRPLNGAFFPTFLPLGGGMVLANDGEWSMVPQLSNAGRTLAQTITSIAARVGVTAGELDVTACTQSVSGLVIDRQMSARAALQPLLLAYGVDAVESAGRVKFVPRGGAPVTSMLEAEFGASREGAGGAAFERSRQHQSELPQAVSVQYSDLDAAYEVGSQPAARGQVVNDVNVSVPLPLALTAADAAKIANRALYEAWASRSRRAFSTTARYAALEPTDVVWIEHVDGRKTRERIDSKQEDDGLISWETTADDDGAQLQVSNGMPLPPPAEIGGPPAVSRGIVFEAPPLRDEHGSVLGIYASAAPFGPSWPGAELWVNTPGDSDYLSVAALPTPGVVGQALTALSARGATVGQLSPEVLDVSLTGGEPATVTEPEWLAGANLAYVGGELIRYREKSSIAGGWRLKGLMRGQHGTDYAGAGHAVGDVVVLLDDLSAVPLVIRPSNEIEATREFRAVTLGASVLATPATRLLLKGRTLRPLSPVHVTMVRQANGDRTIRWFRRTRAWQDWREAADIPLLDAPEQYALKILRVDNGALLREATVGVAEYTYTAAQIATDWPIVPPASIRVQVAQISSLVGAGEWADTTVAWAGDYNYQFVRDFNEYATAGQAIADMSAFGLAPSVSSSQPTGAGWPSGTRAARLSNNSASLTDVKGRFDAVPAFSDGALRWRTPKIYNVFGTNKHAGMVARTTYWRNNTVGFGYAVNVYHQPGGSYVRIGRGDNANTGNYTQLAVASLGTTSTDVSEFVWRLNGTSHKVWVDGILRLDVTDSAITAAGQCGLWFYGDYQEAADFDDIRIDHN